ncbi:hypothetical protein X963_4202 [Burkholderia pseudomallei MSHR7498]|nr:hypothetical protein DP43_3925 [Burkholderia pseudomallei]KGR93616.1 hypothetical protein X948_5486 [Burkholderia pseudomallei MSHR5608]KGS16863.1 hypothetical protein X989_5720 [Burkholderia pseudomallei MSHR4378]KGS36548.1 hypothetical protein X992_5953 [Burkholderia pseudomallei MSHR5492]KGS93889.1 hypothetical protein X963_4202 [Burkholderia pseudomallei MSHR7498]
MSRAPQRPSKNAQTHRVWAKPPKCGDGGSAPGPRARRIARARGLRIDLLAWADGRPAMPGSHWS